MYRKFRQFSEFYICWTPTSDWCVPVGHVRYNRRGGGPQSLVEAGRQVLQVPELLHPALRGSDLCVYLRLDPGLYPRVAGDISEHPAIQNHLVTGEYWLVNKTEQ